MPYANTSLLGLPNLSAIRIQKAVIKLNFSIVDQSQVNFSTNFDLEQIFLEFVK